MFWFGISSKQRQRLHDYRARILGIYEYNQQLLQMKMHFNCCTYSYLYFKTDTHIIVMNVLLVFQLGKM